MIRKDYKSLFVFDLETTGLSFKNDRIIEIGLLFYELDENKNKFELIKEYDFLIKIDFKIPEKIVELTHITDEMLEKSGISEIEMFSIIEKYIKKDTLIMGYNVQFDYSFLNELFLRYKGIPLKCDALDVLAMYKDRYPYPHKLKDAIDTFSVTIPNSHRAIDDVKATFEVLRGLIKVENDMHLYVNKFGYNPKYPIENKFDHINYIAQLGGKLEIKKSHR